MTTASGDADIGRQVLPSPTNLYSAPYMRRLIESITRLLGSKLNRNEPAVYGGVPYSRVKGTNNAFAVGTSFVKLPFNTTVQAKDTLVTFDPVNYNYTTAIGTVLQVSVSIYLATGGNTDLTAALYVNGAAYGSQQASIKNGQYVTFSGVVSLNAGDVFDVRALADHSVTVDMTQSFFSYMRLESDPRVGSAVGISLA